MNEITAVEEQRNALAEQCNLEIPMTIQIKKSFGGTQMVAIRMSVNSVRLAPQISKQMDKCFRYMKFGHQTRNCKGPEGSTKCNENENNSGASRRSGTIIRREALKIRSSKRRRQVINDRGNAN